MDDHDATVRPFQQAERVCQIATKQTGIWRTFQPAPMDIHGARDARQKISASFVSAICGREYRKPRGTMLNTAARTRGISNFYGYMPEMAPRLPG